MRLFWLVSLLVGCGRFGFSGNGTIDVDQTSVDFAMLACGASTTQTVTLHDGGDGPVAFVVTSDVPGIDVTPTGGTLLPGGSAPISVMAMADPDGLPGAAMSGELVITTDQPTANPTVVPITLTTAGGVLSANQTTIDFGQVTTATAHSKSVMVTNSGNTTMAVTAGPYEDPDFSITSAMSFNLDAGASQAIDVQFDPSLGQAYSYQLPLSVSTAMCQPMPMITTVGVGTLSTVLLDHTTLDFGAVSCGSAAAPMTLTVTNGNASSYPFTASVTAGSSSFTANPTSGTVPASGQSMITVTRAAIQSPATTGMVSGNLHVVVTGPPMGTTDVPLKYDVSGSSLSPSTTSIDFGTVSQTTNRTVTITNSGNAVANVQVTHSGSSHFSAPSSFQISPNSMKSMTITFSTTSTQLSTATFSLSAANQCSPSFSIQVMGSGTGSGSGSGSGGGGDDG